MKKEHLKEFERHLTRAFKKFLTETPIHELRKIDWFSSNADFYIEQDKQKKAA